MSTEILNRASLLDEMVCLRLPTDEKQLEGGLGWPSDLSTMSMAVPLVFSSKVGYALSRGIQHGVLDCSHEKEQRMKTIAFERWCDRYQLPTATRDFVLLLLLAASRDDS